jgi:hypothetical protein
LVGEGRGPCTALEYLASELSSTKLEVSMLGEGKQSSEK